MDLMFDGCASSEKRWNPGAAGAAVVVTAYDFMFGKCKQAFQMTCVISILLPLEVHKTVKMVHLSIRQVK